MEECRRAVLKYWGETALQSRWLNGLTKSDQWANVRILAQSASYSHARVLINKLKSKNIKPSRLSKVFKSLKVSRKDLLDACKKVSQDSIGFYGELNDLIIRHEKVSMLVDDIVVMDKDLRSEEREIYISALKIRLSKNKNDAKETEKQESSTDQNSMIVEEEKDSEVAKLNARDKNHAGDINQDSKLSSLEQSAASMISQKKKDKETEQNYSRQQLSLEDSKRRDEISNKRASQQQMSIDSSVSHKQIENDVSFTEKTAVEVVHRSLNALITLTIAIKEQEAEEREKNEAQAGTKELDKSKKSVPRHFIRSMGSVRAASEPRDSNADVEVTFLEERRGRSAGKDRLQQVKHDDKNHGYSIVKTALFEKKKGYLEFDEKLKKYVFYPEDSEDDVIVIDY